MNRTTPSGPAATTPGWYSEPPLFGGLLKKKERPFSSPP